MIDIFGNPPIRLDKLVCHSGGAIGSDTYFETIGDNYGVKTKAYSYKTKYHTTENKVEISDSDYEEGVKEITKANRVLSRYGIHKFMNLLARNWSQVKYSDEVFAIGTIVEPGKKGSKGFYNKSEFQVVDGGTGYAVQIHKQTYHYLLSFTNSIMNFSINFDLFIFLSFIIFINSL